MLFNDEIGVTGTRANSRQVATSLPARIVDDGIPADSVEGYLSPEIDQFAFFIRIADWPDTDPPLIGDVVTWHNSSYKVSRVNRLGDCFSLTARAR